MSVGQMHVDEVGTDATLVGRLLATQFPQWADLPIEPVASAGTDYALYRLGADMAVRLPRIEWAIAHVGNEQRWLPKLAPQLPLAIPVPLAQGAPGDGHPWPWSVYRWLDGENTTIERIADPHHLAKALAQFIIALRRIDPTGGPPPGQHNSSRGVPLAARDASTHAAISALRGVLDTDAATAAWEADVRALTWHGPPVWIHGDLQSGNLLAVEGRLSAVIDFGCLGVGDPACDLIIAWNLLTSETRADFRAALAVDDATWARGRGWALSIGLIALAYYQTTNRVRAGISRYAIAEVLTDHTYGA